MTKQFTERAVAIPGGPLGDRAAVAVLGDSQADVAREALRMARAESLNRPVLLIDLLGQGSALERMLPDDDPHGVSDAARYGISLARVARRVPDADSLYVVSGGLESPLADDVLSDHMWGSWSDQCRRAGALLVVAAPADVPVVMRAVDQLDGVIMVGDAIPPETQAPVIGRLSSPRHRRGVVADGTTPRRITPDEIAVVRQSTTTRIRGGGLAIGLAAGAVVLAAGMWWAVAGGLLGLDDFSARPSRAGGAAPIEMPGHPIPESPTTIVPPALRGVAEWAVELASVSSMPGALARVRQSADSVPVPTFTPIRPGGGASATLWYRLVAGAFTSMASADSLLAALRDRGVIEGAGGRVIRAPLGWLLEDGVRAEQVPERLFAWRQQGLPAYALHDSAGLARVYVGAFENEEEGRLLLPVLDSLNLHATLAPRVGSLR